MSISNQLIIGGLLYGKVAFSLHIIFDGEADMRLVFNLGLSIIGLCAGLVVKAIENKRAA